MLKIFARFITVMIVIAGIYLAYTNTTQTTLQQIKGKESILVNFQNFPEIILSSKDGNTGYQYELLKDYLYKLDKQKIEIRDSKYDIQNISSAIINEDIEYISKHEIMKDYYNKDLVFKEDYERVIKHEKNIKLL